MILTLEAYCKARGYQGGHIFMMLEDIATTKINRNTDPYKWGLREARTLRRGYNIASYNVPVNSWDEDSESTIEYICGLYDGLEQAWNETKEFIGADIDSPTDPYF